MSFQNAHIVKVGGNPKEYHAQAGKRGSADFRMGSSSLRAFWSCPEKWVTPIEHADGSQSWWELPSSASTEWGDLFDCMLLTPELFDARYAVRPETYTSVAMVCPSCGSASDSSKSCRACGCKREQQDVQKDWSANSKECKDWAAAQEKEGKETVSQAMLFQIGQAIKRFKRDKILGVFLEEGDKQVWIEGDWRDDETGIVVPCKCLIDVVPRATSEFHKCLGDVKTTKNARVTSWERWAHAVGYEVQAAWYVDLFAAAQPKREITEFCFLLSENSAPYQTGRRYMSQDLIDPNNDIGDIESGRKQYRQMMADYCRCLKAGFWPGFDDTDESAGGWTLIRPDPYAEQRRQFAPHYAMPTEDEPAGEMQEDAAITP